MRVAVGLGQPLRDGRQRGDRRECRGAGLLAVRPRVGVPGELSTVETCKAHLRLEGARRARVAAAVRDQLGVELTDMHPFGLAAPPAPPPCRLLAEGGPPGTLFAKL